MYSIAAPITMSSAPAALAAGMQALAAGEREFSLAALDGLSDSSAIALMLAWQRQAVISGKPLHFVDIPDTVLHFAELYDVVTLLTGSMPR